MQRGQIKQAVAQKVSLKMLTAGKYITQEGWNANYVLTPDDRKIERVNIIGIVTIPPQGTQHTSCMMEDGSGSVTIQIYNPPEVHAGECVCVIGRPFFVENSISISGDIMKPLNAAWMRVRKEELKHIEDMSAIPTQKIQTPAATPTQQKTPPNILEIIKVLDAGDGADIEGVLAQLKEKEVTNAEEQLNRLLRDGEVFESRKGKVKVIE